MSKLKMKEKPIAILSSRRIVFGRIRMEFLFKKNIDVK